MIKNKIIERLTFSLVPGNHSTLLDEMKDLLRAFITPAQRAAKKSKLILKSYILITELATPDVYSVLNFIFDRVNIPFDNSTSVFNLLNKKGRKIRKDY